MAERQLKFNDVERSHLRQNQFYACWRRYSRFVLCAEVKGAEDPVCQAIRNAASSICPEALASQWDEWREEGRFPAPLPYRVDGVMKHGPGGHGGHDDHGHSH
eukprot:GILK01001598.1.p2 GENE.GILK01001598.1~~GILK01001598.1.p2  ORF type:complete len:103 (+),score=9.50 GILK01001598.1:39-347(+)